MFVRVHSASSSQHPQRDSPPYAAVNYRRPSLPSRHSSCLKQSAAACHVCSINVCLLQTHLFSRCYPSLHLLLYLRSDTITIRHINRSVLLTCFLFRIRVGGITRENYLKLIRPYTYFGANRSRILNLKWQYSVQQVSNLYSSFDLLKFRGFCPRGFFGTYGLLHGINRGRHHVNKRHYTVSQKNVPPLNLSLIHI